MRNYKTWEEYINSVELTPELEAQIKYEKSLIDTLIKIRDEQHVSQRDLEEKCGIKQPQIARIERMKSSPRVSTLISLLAPLGYTIKIVPIKK